MLIVDTDTDTTKGQIVLFPRERENRFLVLRRVCLFSEAHCASIKNAGTKLNIDAKV